MAVNFKRILTCYLVFFRRSRRAVSFGVVVLTSFMFTISCSAAATVATEQTQNKPAQKQLLNSLKNPQLIAPDIRQILERGSLTVAILVHNAPPFVIENDAGKLSGLDINLLQDFAKRLNLTLNFNKSAKTYEELVELVANNQADLAACGVSRTLHRAIYVNFTKPYLKLHQGLLINRLKLAKQVHSHSWDEVIKDLRSSLGVLAGSSYVKFARRHLDKMEITLFPSIAETQKAVFDGTVTAAYLDELDIKMLIRNRPDQALRCQTVLFKDVPDYISFPVARKKPQLLRLLNIYIEEHPIELTIDQILDKYLPTVVIKK